MRKLRQFLIASAGGALLCSPVSAGPASPSPNRSPTPSSRSSAAGSLPARSGRCRRMRNGPSPPTRPNPPPALSDRHSSALPACSTRAVASRNPRKARRDCAAEAMADRGRSLGSTRGRHPERVPYGRACRQPVRTMGPSGNPFPVRPDPVPLPPSAGPSAARPGYHTGLQQAYPRPRRGPSLEGGIRPAATI